uniref:hypothetical protein n=1 Tax=Methylobacterium sp. B34 TaxID=95563 RepID=UPI0005B27FB2|nr:hypothetical protein [Methylobacterium sp. B34]
MTGTVILTAVVTLVAAAAFSLASVAKAKRSGLQVDSLREDARRAAHSATGTSGAVTAAPPYEAGIRQA